MASGFSAGTMFLFKIITENLPVSIFSNNGITKEHFFTKDDVAIYDFAFGHYHKYGKLPDKVTLFKAFPDIKNFKLPGEPLTYFIDRLISTYQRYKLKEVVDIINSDLRDDVDPLIIQDRVQTDLRQIMSVSGSKSTNNILSFDQVIDIVLEDSSRRRIHTEGISGASFGFDFIDQVTDGAQGGDFITLAARPGCLSGDTLIYVAYDGDGSGRWYKLSEVYAGFNGMPIKRDNGTTSYWQRGIVRKTQSLMEHNLTGLNIIKSVIFSGVKTTYTITTREGKSIRATGDHPFLTPSGFVRVDNLKVGDKVICKAPKTIKKGKKFISKYKEICTALPYSPYKVKIVSGVPYNRVFRSRLNYDANLNNLTPSEFIHGLKNNPNNNFVFSDKNKHIHHIDGDKSNDHFTNLLLVSVVEHNRTHDNDKPLRTHFGKNLVHEETIESIELFGKEDTYDISMTEPFHNFIANGFVVHNCGKTHILLNSAKGAYQQGKKVMIATFEMPPKQLGRRLIERMTNISSRNIKFGMLSTRGDKRIVQLKENVIKQDREGRGSLSIYHGSLYTRVGSLSAAIDEIKPDVLFVDGAYLLKISKTAAKMHEHVAESAHFLKDIALTRDIPVIATYQINREGKKSGGLDHMMYSDAMAQLASIAFTIKDVSEGKGGVAASWGSSLRRILRIDKGRDGEMAEVEVELSFGTKPFSVVRIINGDLSHLNIPTSGGSGNDINDISDFD